MTITQEYFIIQTTHTDTRIQGIQGHIKVNEALEATYNCPPVPS